MRTWITASDLRRDSSVPTMTAVTILPTMTTLTMTITATIFLLATLPPCTLSIKIGEIHRPIVLTTKPSLSRQPRQRYPDGRHYHDHMSIIITITSSHNHHHHHQCLLTEWNLWAQRGGSPYLPTKRHISHAGRICFAWNVSYGSILTTPKQENINFIQVLADLDIIGHWKNENCA